MKTISVSIAEGKKNFSRLIQDAGAGREDVIVTKRGKLMAVIVPYGEYELSARVEAHKKIMEARKAFLEAGISADKIYRESRAQLKRKP